VKTFRYAFIEVGVIGAKNDSHRPIEFSKAGSGFRARSHGIQQILVQSEKRRASAGIGVELPIQQRNKLVPHPSVGEEPADLPPVHAPEDPIVEHA